MDGSVSSRLRLFIESRGMRVSQFESSIGAANGFVKNISKGIGVEKMRRISQEYPELNRDWLLYGEGEMIKEQPSAPLSVSSTSVTEQGEDYHADAQALNTRVIPLYDVVAAAGTAYGVDMSPHSQPLAMIEAGSVFASCTMAIRVYGESMVPSYPNGCFIGLRQVHAIEEIEPGRVYVIETADTRYLKRVYFSQDDAYFRLISDNTDRWEDGAMKGELIYPEFSIPKANIKRIFVVLAMADIKGM